MSVHVRENNIDRALKSLKIQSAPILSAAREKQTFTKKGVRLREEKKKNTINSRKNSRRNDKRSDYKYKKVG